jgi:hypothetical protein
MGDHLQAEELQNRSLQYPIDVRRLTGHQSAGRRRRGQWDREGVGMSATYPVTTGGATGGHKSATPSHMGLPS